jgi:hypothetical protein
MRLVSAFALTAMFLLAASQQAKAQDTVLRAAFSPNGSQSSAPVTTHKLPRFAQFCGQCTQDSDCGVGHKCCPMSGCSSSKPNACYAVTTCP